MTSYNHRQYVFKCPKPLQESNSNNNNNRLLTPNRPQPSPSKREILMQELGLDGDSDETSGSSDLSDFSDDDIFNKTTGGPTQAEYNALQIERDNLLVRNKDFQNQLLSYKGRLHREEVKRKNHVDILKKTQQDIIKDKDRLITNLEDIVFDGEQRIKQLEDDLKGNPIRPLIEKPAHVSSVQKLVDSIKNLHQEKSDMRGRILDLEQKMEDKTSEILTLRENRPDDKELVERSQSKTDSEKVIEKLNKEIGELRVTMEKKEEEIFQEKQNAESAQKDVENIQKKLKKAEENLKKLEKKSKTEIEKLRRDLEKKNEEIYDLESKPPEIVTRTVEKVVEVESSEQKSEIDEARNRLSELEQVNREAARASKKAKDEIIRLKNEISRYQSQLQDARTELEENSSSYQEEESKMRSDIKHLEVEVTKMKKNLEKGKKNLNKEKEKVTELEQELQELKASSRRAKDEFMVEIESLKRKMTGQEEEMTREINEANDSAESQRIESENVVKKLETKMLKTEEKLRITKEQNQELHVKLNEYQKKVENQNDAIESKENQIVSLQNAMAEMEIAANKEKRKLIETQQKLVDASDVNMMLQNQVKDLSGVTDSATVELSELRGENSKLRIELNHARVLAEDCAEKLRNAGEREEMMNEQLRQIQQQSANERNEHQRSIEILEEQHANMMSSLKTSANAEVHAVSSKVYKLQCSLRQILSTVHVLIKENQHLKRECSKFPQLIEEATRHAGKQISEAISEINDNSKELVRRYIKEMKLRKKYHNELVELKGNIRVFVRVRPTISEDGSGAQIRNAVTYDRDDDSMIYVHNSQRGRSQLFELDKVFQPDSTQVQVYSEVQPLVISCIDGFHVCIFAYGQTGSGKTYTMEGPDHDPGINQRALGNLFSEIEERTGEWEYEVTVSLVEIYNEMLKDLLCSSSSGEKLEIKMNGDGSLYIPRLTSRRVANLDDVNALFKLGHTNRATACTNMNEHSSRSHAVLIVNVHGTNKTSGVKTFGKLNLIDLAGSERVSKSGAAGDRLKEAQNINKSLSALGDVIHALRGKLAHVPFRNSKLTYMLQDSLSKDSKTLMVVQVAPVEKNVSETLCSLAFAQRVRSVELGQASKKVEDGKSEDSSTPRKAGIPSKTTPMRRK